MRARGSVRLESALLLTPLISEPDLLLRAWSAINVRNSARCDIAGNSATPVRWTQAAPRSNRPPLEGLGKKWQGSFYRPLSPVSCNAGEEGRHEERRDIR